MNKWVIFFVVPLGLVVGCGGSGATEGLLGSCAITFAGGATTCQEYFTAAGPASAPKDYCSSLAGATGVWSDGACSRTGSIGYCTVTQAGSGDLLAKAYYFPPSDASDAETACDSLAAGQTGVWTATP